MKHHPAYHGFTMIEMVVALSITAILVVAMGSALLLAGQATPRPDDPMTGSLRSHDALTVIAGELSYALDVTELTATAVTFTIADQDGDNAPETIRYTWLGDDSKAGAITRAENGGTPVTWLEDVPNFTITYHIDAVQNTSPGPPTIGADTAVSSFSGVSSVRNFNVNGSSWPAQPIDLNAPSGTTGLYVSGVYLRMRIDEKEGGAFTVQVRSADIEGKPTGATWTQRMVSTSSLSGSYNWIYIDLDDSVEIPLQDLCLVVEHLWGDSDEDVEVRGGASTGRSWISYNDGSTWSEQSLDAFDHTLYAKFVTPGPDVVTTVNYLNSVEVTLQSNTDTVSRAQRTIALRNRPEVTP